MPEIVRRGERHKPRWLGCWECPRCGSVLRLEERDAAVVLDRDDQRDGYMVEFPCPVCGNCPGAGNRMPCTYYSKRVICPAGSNDTEDGAS